MTAGSDSLQARVSALVVNFQTPDLLETAVRSFKRAYPEVPLTIVDNGSKDESPRLIESLVSVVPNVSAQYLAENVFHGPAMHRGLEESTTPYTYVFDSDTDTRRDGFLEAIVRELDADPRAYGAGVVVNVNRRGFARPTGIPVLSSAHMVLRTEQYRRLPSFVHHGLPALENFRAAHAQGLRLVHWPIDAYVDHLGRGTAARYGYGLGIRAKIDYVMSRLGL